MKEYYKMYINANYREIQLLSYGIQCNIEYRFSFRYLRKMYVLTKKD